MCAAHHNSGALALLLSLDDKFVNNSQNKTLLILKHTITLLIILATELQSQDIVKDLQLIMGDAQLILQPQFLQHK
jgi:hypothetical protein